MGLSNSRAGATRVTLEEKRRRDREIALEDGVSEYPASYPILCFDMRLHSRVRKSPPET
jgi:hypothetical protein